MFRNSISFLPAIVCSALLTIGCSSDDPPSETGDSGDDSGVSTDDNDSDGDDDPSKTEDEDDDPTPDDNDDDEGNTPDFTPNSGNPACEGVDGECFPIDLLFVIDNSGTMGEEQMNLAENFGKLIEQLKNLKLSNGKDARPVVNLMVTTTDMGHPICTPFEHKDYDPAQGAPISDTCLDRIQNFTGLGENPPKFEEACEDFCSDSDMRPDGNFISFGPYGKNSNVPDDEIAKALSCIGPQGVNGCGYEAPLESMLQALNPNAKWNMSGSDDKPFLRDGAILAVAIVTDEADCSVKAPDGYEYFTNEEKDDYWEVDPNSDGKKRASSAICWNAGVECTGEKDGVYKECHSIDNGVLHPLSRYTEYFQYLKDVKDKEIVMLGILGVPEVTEHNEVAPFEPTAGGVFDLKYKEWEKGDILPDDAGATPESKSFEFGIGPGCTGDGTGQAVPPVRVKEVCESLNEYDDAGNIKRVGCCIESICDDDFSNAIRCLSGLLEVIEPPK